MSKQFLLKKDKRNFGKMIMCMSQTTPAVFITQELLRVSLIAKTYILTLNLVVHTSNDVIYLRCLDLFL
jgi:hypothetical protein